MILVFSTSDRWISKAIRRVTGSRVSHVAFLTLASEQTVVLHADVGGVQFTPLAEFLRKNRIVEAYERATCTTRDEACSLARAMAKLGDSYDYASIVTRAVARFVQWFGVKFRNPLRSPRSVVCSEFVARTVSDFARYSAEDVEPEDLRSHCANSDRWRRFVLVA